MNSSQTEEVRLPIESMSQPAKGEVVVASAGYYVARAMLVASGFVSMPVMTRLLSKEEYGLLSLIFASVAFLGAFGRAGFPHATTRFFAEQSRLGKDQLRHFCESMLTGALASSILVAIIAAAFLGPLGGGNPHFMRSMRLACLVVVIRVVSGMILEFYRAQHRVRAYSTAQIVARYSTVGLAIVLLLTMGRSTYEVVLATALGEGAVVLVCLIHLGSSGVIRRPRASWQLIASATRYGSPLTLVGASALLIGYGDRFLIERFLGLDAVAKYTVPYDLTESLARSAFAPVQLAALPIVFQMWAEHKREEASRFISEVATYLVAAAIPIATLFLILNREIIILIASSKYGESASLTPYLIAGVFVGELSFLVACGLRLSKDTGIAAIITLLGAALNVGLNVILLPIVGLAGAAMATTATYAAMGAAMYIKSLPVLRLRLAYGRIGRSLLATGLMSCLILSLGQVSSAAIVDMAIRGILGLAVAAGCMWVLDQEIRAHIWSWSYERR